MFKNINSTSRSHFSTFCFVRVVILFFAFFLRTNVIADNFANIGSGNPALKVVMRPGSLNAVVIYHVSPELPIGGPIGAWSTNYNIHVIVDHGYGFLEQKTNSLSIGGPSELYPFGPNSAFTDNIGAMKIMKPPVWLSWPPEVGYTLIGNDLTTFTNVREQAQMKYHLHGNEFFLGYVDGNVFFIKDNPKKVFWRAPGSEREYYYSLPKDVIDIFGVTKALDPDKDVGFIVLRKTVSRKASMFSNMFLPPHEEAFIEVSISSGKLLRSEE